ncbi:MAG TPA: hypothetical protein VFY04_05915 [Solirubrobacterales bacterium]|nr:hypothetical protein [Solirubrobacterales bacterium]
MMLSAHIAGMPVEESLAAFAPVATALLSPLLLRIRKRLQR